ncbi:MAG TPA: hypothetical protein VF742_09385 [Terracidiphilus sp.]
MPQMLDLIRNSQVPVNLMQSAARGSLSVPPGEMIEILVYLAVHHKIFGEQARLTLAGWDEKASLAAAQDPATSAEVLKYWTAMENLRPHLLPALVENPSVGENALSELAAQGTRATVEVLLASPRVLNSSVVLQALQTNPTLRPNELTGIGNKLSALGTAVQEVSAEDESHVPREEVEHALTQFLTENAAELEAEKEKPFQPIGGMHDEPGAGVAEIEVQADVPADTAAEVSAATAPVAAATAPAVVAKPASAHAAAVHAKKHAHPPGGERRDSPLQKISKLDIKGRIALAVRGTKEDRSILIRDGTKLVALAVLDSPKITDGEVEKIALQKNVLQAVLRAIPLKRRFAKNYSIMRNLVYNPRTPLDLSLGLMKNLLIHDLKNLSGNKEVPETIRKLALRMFKQKIEKK